MFQSVYEQSWNPSRDPYSSQHVPKPHAGRCTYGCVCLTVMYITLIVDCDIPATSQRTLCLWELWHNSHKHSPLTNQLQVS